VQTVARHTSFFESEFFPKQIERLLVVSMVMTGYGADEAGFEFPGLK
jgi:hypothetical protein